MFRYESLEDCPLDEDEDAFQGLGEEDEEIDQFNDDTFGSGAVGMEPHSTMDQTHSLLVNGTTLQPTEPSGQGLNLTICQQTPRYQNEVDEIGELSIGVVLF